MKPARIAVICIAAVAAIGLALVVRAMGSSSGKPTATASAAAVEPARPMAKVLVAARDLAPGQRLTDADLTWKDWPADEVNPAFITDGSVPVPQAPAADGNAAEAPKTEGAVARVTRAAADIAGGSSKSEYFGSVVREPILAGEPIIGRKIVRAGDSGYMAAYLEPGMRAMAVAVSTETAAGGFILPGDRVDVIVTIELERRATETAANDVKYASRIVLQNVKVLAIDQSTRAEDDQQAVVGATATLEIAPGDTEALALAKAAGVLSLTLRSYADTAGPSGRVGQARASTVRPSTVRVFRGGEPETVNVP